MILAQSLVRTVVVVLADEFKVASALQHSLRYSELWIPTPREPLSVEEGARFHNLADVAQISEITGNGTTGHTCSWSVLASY